MYDPEHPIFPTYFWYEKGVMVETGLMVFDDDKINYIKRKQ